MNTASAIASVTPAPVPVPAATPDAGPMAEPEAIELNLDNPENPNRTDESEWADLVSVLNDEREGDLLRRIFRLQRDIGAAFYFANKTDDPRAIAKRASNAINGFKSILDQIRALDRHRHGTVQDIIVEQVGERPWRYEPTVRDQKLATSDKLIDEIFLSHGANLDDLASRCRMEGQRLAALPSSELLHIECGRRRGPDCRNWETKFFDMAARLMGHTTKFRLAIEKCHGHKPQHIRVTRVGNVPKGKRKKNSAMTPNGSNGGTPHADVASTAN